MTQHQVGDELGWNKSKLLRIEAGQVGITPTDLRALLDLYGVDDPEIRAATEALARETRHAPWVEYHKVLSSNERRFLTDEGTASRVRVFESTLTPDLLRTHQYARTLARVLAPPGFTSRILGRSVDVLKARQDAILTAGSPPELHFVVDETAVIRLAAQPEDGAMIRGQVAHLLQLAERPNISVQILPISGGVHAGLAVGPFVLLDFDHPNDAGLLYLPGGQRPIVEDAGRIARYSSLFTELAAAASPPDAIRTTLARHFADPGSVTKGQHPHKVSHP